MNRRFSFLTWHDTGTREVDVLVCFNATPGRPATHLDPPEPVEIEDLDVEADPLKKEPATTAELEAIRADAGAMRFFKELARTWVRENRHEL